MFSRPTVVPTLAHLLSLAADIQRLLFDGNSFLPSQAFIVFPLPGRKTPSAPRAPADILPTRLPKVAWSGNSDFVGRLRRLHRVPPGSKGTRVPPGPLCDANGPKSESDGIM